MPKRAPSTPFLIAERVVIGLYDGGVLSPAVLERVLKAFVQDVADWQTTPDLRSVDGRSLHEIVVSTMMPDHAGESVPDSFIAVIEHLADSHTKASNASVEADSGDTTPAKRRAARKKQEPEEEADNGELLAQLSGSAKAASPGRSRGAKREASSAGFNPFVNAAPPRRK
ncbi:hypothetical protein [Paraburkholderia sp. BCC1886]|uniref:hypothetical protein n=1 Tax=Paraburkholderia sp. BCC1886 TaxID=2562670 RepID=UPI001181DA11|nr:hypothetical protein [Paraburkholderia sp. BCC1886]